MAVTEAKFRKSFDTAFRNTMFRQGGRRNGMAEVDEGLAGEADLVILSMRVVMCGGIIE